MQNCAWTLPPLILVLTATGVFGKQRLSVVETPFLSFTSEDSQIGVELGLTIPLMKVPLEGAKRPPQAGKFLSAPIEINLPALAVAATMFVTSAVIVPKVFQLLAPVTHQPAATDEFWSGNISGLKSILNPEEASEGLGETHYGLPSSLPRPRSKTASRRTMKRHAGENKTATRETFCNGTTFGLPGSVEFDPN